MSLLADLDTKMMKLRKEIGSLTVLLMIGGC